MMKEPANRPLFSDLLGELHGLADEMREMAVARWALARLELTEDLHSVRRLALFLTVSVVLLLAVLPLLVMALAETLDGCYGLAGRSWLLIFAGSIVLSAGLIAWSAWRSFRRRFIGLEETLEELREDAIWLKELQNGYRKTPPAAASTKSGQPQA